MNEYGERINEYKGGKERSVRFMVICVFLIVWFAALIAANRCFFYYIEVNGPSMMNTLKSGDILCVQRYKKAERGSVVIIAGEKGDDTCLIKRVIGAEGDVIVIEDGDVYLNGEKLDEPYVLGRTYVNKLPVRKEYVVGEDEIFYLGDNRENSNDSRSEMGFCTEDQIVGVVPEWSMSDFMKGVLKTRARISEQIASLFGK